MRWSILVLALLCGYSCQRDEPFVRTVDTLFSLQDQTSTGIDFSNNITEDSKLNYLFYQSIYNGAGCALADFDNDGLLDAYFAGNQVANRLYKNIGKGAFEDVTGPSGTGDDSGWSTGVCTADLNNDGLTDIYVSRFLLMDSSKRTNLCYINKGGMVFEEAASSLGIDDDGYSIHSTVIDYDKDGDLDLYVVNQPPNHSSLRMKIKGKIDHHFTDRLYRNDGNKFTDVTAEAGITNFAYGLTAIASDLNEDGWTDVYVACDFDEPDLMYINNGDGTFTDQAEVRLEHMSNFSMGADIADINNDGLLDIFTADMVAEDNKRLKTNMSGMNPEKFYALVDSGYHHQYMFNALQLNRGEGQFSEIAQYSGVSTTDWSWSALFGDYDNDGHKDLLVTNGLKRDVRDNDFNIARRKRVKELQQKAKAEGKSGVSVNPLELLAMSPSTPIANYIYRSNGDLTFENSREKWGLSQKLISQGAAYGDIDNDGDLDIILNNMDASAAIYLNNSEYWAENHSLQVEFEGNSGINSKVTVYAGPEKFHQEMTPIRGYMSSSSPILHFGLGDNDRIDSLIVRWSGGSVEVFDNVKSDTRIRLKAGSGRQIKEQKETGVLFSEEELLTHRHIENSFNDFKTEILLPHRMSTLGPTMSVADVNGDGLDDLFIGGSRVQKSTIYFGTENGFKTAQELSGSLIFEDTGSAFFDHDGDGDMDLYVVSGGNEERENFSSYQDRLYVNDGKGNFEWDEKALPEITQSGSVVLPHDIDGDGDLEIFVGGRQIPGKWPYPPKNLLLFNNNGEYTDGCNRMANDLQHIGMVTDAEWVDLDNDDVKELVVVGEWMRISIFKVKNGTVELWKEIDRSRGWWESVLAGDFDGDGDMDIALGNLGLNIKYKTSPEEPFQVFSADFDDNGSNDIYLGYYQDGKCFPVRGRQCSSQQLPFVKEKFPTYDEFSEATIFEVLGEDTAGALNYRAEIFESIFLWNENGDFRIQAMPAEAQFSVINSMIHHDFNKDGSKELLIAGNQHDREVETTRSDASKGVLLSFNGNAPSVKGCPMLEGDIRDMVLVENNDKSLIIIAENDDQARCFIPSY